MTDAAQSDRPKRRWKIWLRRFAVTIVIVLVVGELGLRFVFGLGTPLLYQADPDCVYLPKPDQHIYRFFAHNNINHYSMRSAPFDMPRPKDHERVLFIGDSVTYGTTYVDQSLIFTSRLAATLPMIEHKPVDVLNASAGGWSIGSELGYLRSRGTFDSNIVLFVLNTGDPSQPAPAGPFSASLPFPTERPWTAIGETWFHYVAPRLFHKPIASDPGTTLPTLDEELKTTAKNMQLLDQANAFCKKSGTIFGIVYVPFAGITGPPADRAHAALLSWTETNHAPFIDVSPAFVGEKVDALTFEGAHLRPYGNEVVARDIARQWGIVDAYLSTATAP